MNISFVGLGKLGLPLACCLAQSGNKVLGVDKNEYVLDTLSEGRLPFYEPGLGKIFPHVNFIGFTDSYQRAIDETDATIILVNTQLGDDGYSSEFVEDALTDLAMNLRKSTKERHLIVLSSTVLPGTIKKLIKLVEKISKRKYGEGFGFSYVPDFVKLGNVIEDFKNPEFFLVGANNMDDIVGTQSIWYRFHENDAPKKILTLEEAEIAKVALNAYIVNKITFANFLGQLCEGIENVSVHNITKTIGIDKRISPYFFGYGTPYGGTCFPRDTSAFIKFAKDRKKTAKNLMFAEEVNEMVYKSILDKVKKHKKVGVLGISFKPNSPVVIGSPSYILIKDLLDLNIQVNVYDPIPETFDTLEFDDIFIHNDPQFCINDSDAVLIMHPNKKFSEYNYENKVVVDNWGILNFNKMYYNV
jgi:UDPglucose 6-dehydrogenase